MNNARDRPAPTPRRRGAQSGVIERSEAEHPEGRASQPAESAPRVMVISESKVQRQAWARAVRGAGGRVIGLASIEAAVLLLESAPYPSPTHVLISAASRPDDDEARAQLETLGPDRLASIIYVEVAALRAFTRADPTESIGRRTSVSMPVTEAALKVALGLER